MIKKDDGYTMVSTDKETRRNWWGGPFPITDIINIATPFLVKISFRSMELQVQIGVVYRIRLDTVDNKDHVISTNLVLLSTLQDYLSCTDTTKDS